VSIGRTDQGVQTFPSLGFSTAVGIQNVQKVTTPAAGAEWTFTLPGGYYYRVLSGTATFTTSAAVANRSCGVQVTDGANVIWAAANSTAIAASLTSRPAYTYASITNNVGGAKGALNVMVPAYWLPPGYVISSQTTNMDVADTYTAVVLFLEQFDFGRYGQPMVAHPPTIDEFEAITQAP
jgi:hypothetical protein